MKPVIEVKGLSKKYKIGHESQSMHPTIKDQIVKLAKKPFGGKEHIATEEFWALRNVSFSVNQGEAIGIVGKNGSGKSTLLKMLSRIVDPTEGEIILRGKIASLLEVGTGFHPELTGRENIYFNGSILGMTKKEIESKFREIVDFAEVEKFLDTPVKYYSSGMYVRLAFAVAAHIDPDVLIVDEVLSVGDAQFQQKCLAHMEKLFRGGKTILFVSHNMNLVRKLCRRAVLLTNGTAKEYDSVDDLAADYLIMGGVMGTGKAIKVRAGDHIFSNFTVNGKPFSSEIVVPSGEPITLEAAYANTGKPADLQIGFGIKNAVTGDFPIYTHNKLEKVDHKTGKSGNLSVELLVPKLAPGNYEIEVAIVLDGEIILQDEKVGHFRILEVPAFASQQILDAFPSSILVDSLWRFSKDNENPS